jgi:hypothetical protein
MFRITKKPSSGSHKQYLAKNTGLVQCRYRRRTDVVSAMVALYDLRDVCVVTCASVYTCTGHKTQATACSCLIHYHLKGCSVRRTEVRGYRLRECKL